MENILTLINKASESGNIKSLSILKQNNKKSFIDAISSAVILASYNGHINVLNWFKENFTDHNLYSHYAIEMAACNGQINILDWFKKYYDNDIKDILYPVILACNKGHVNVLIWFNLNMSERFRNINFSCAISHASYNGHRHILDWIYNNITKTFEYLDDNMDIAFENEKENILCWYKSKFPNEYIKWNY